MIFRRFIDQTVFGDKRFPLFGKDIDSAQVAIGDVEQALVHDLEPKPWNVSNWKHTEVTVGKRRQVFKVTQGLIAACGIGVVVRMALQVKKCPIGKHVIAVPAMMGLRALITSTR